MRDRSFFTNANYVKTNPDCSTEGIPSNDLSVQALLDAGHKPKSLLKVIRAKCLNCSADQPGEVRKCTVVHCALWPYRLASNPFAKARGDGKAFPSKKPSQNGGKIFANGNEVGHPSEPLANVADSASKRTRDAA